MTIEVAGSDSYVMDNYLPIVLHKNLVDGATDWLDPIMVTSLQTIHQQLHGHL
jgi:hypothetical protein